MKFILVHLQHTMQKNKVKMEYEIINNKLMTAEAKTFIHIFVLPHKEITVKRKT